MSGRSAYMWRQRFPGDGPNRGSMREQRRLRVLRGCQIVGWSFETQTTQAGAERGVDFAEDSPRHWICLGEVFPHAGLLGALAGEKQNDIHR
jgi:hypothetical protein